MDTPRGLSLARRAALALLLTVGFYGLALLIAGGLLFLVYAEFAYLGRINIRLTFFALAGAVAILWAILPRIDRFRAPGPRISETEAPDLFKAITDVARATGQGLPKEVYLVGDVNAFVAERGGAMGIGSRRVMGIGLPLLHLVTVDELKAVIAHEFGHFHGGDTALGPWVYKTRAAILRTVENLGHTSELLQKPFVAYAKLFLQLTNAVSRQQEFTADQLAGRTAGGAVTISGLQKGHKYGLAFQVYLDQEYAPALGAGYKPPMLQGFELFLRAPRIMQAVEEAYEKQSSEGTTDPYDTHPSLKERVAALIDLPPGLSVDDRPASALIAGMGDIEDRLLDAIVVDKSKMGSMKKIGWEQVTELVHLPGWQQTAKSYASVLHGIIASHLPDIAEGRVLFFPRVARAGDFLREDVAPDQVPVEDQVQIIGNVVGSALISALVTHGWTVETSPGEGVSLSCGGHVIKPLEVYSMLVNGTLSAEEWKKTCAESGIADLSL